MIATSPAGWYNGLNPARLSNPGTLTVNAASPSGAYDMSGNVFEWCHDWYLDTYYTGGAVTNPAGPGNGAGRVLRGGAYGSHDSNCRSAFRTWLNPEICNFDSGFRVALSIIETEGEGEVLLEGEGETPVEGEGEVTPEGEGEVPPEGEGEILPEGEGEAVPEGEPQLAAFCDFWPLATGNMWYYTAPIMDACCVRLTIVDQFSVNGYRAWEFKNESDNIAGTQTSYSYWVLVDGWFYTTSQRDDLNLLPAIAGSLTRTWPEYFTLGEPFVGFGEKTWVATLQNADSLLLTVQSDPAIAMSWTRNVGPVSFALLSAYTLNEFTIVGSCDSGEGEGEVVVEGEGEQEDIRLFLPGDVPLDLIRIPAGTFMMGRQENEQDSSADEDPQHEVTFDQGFWMGKYEVTQAQWRAVMNTNPSYFVGDTLPVEQVAWGDAQAFISALNAHLSATAQTLVSVYLPSEAEWEYACRAGTSTRFYWGDDPDYAVIDGYAWYGSNSGNTTHPVGGKLENAFGLHDMAGNVWEWCADRFYAYPEASLTALGEIKWQPDRIFRGGAWNRDGADCRSANRDGMHPFLSSADCGFRVAAYEGMVLEGEPPAEGEGEILPEGEIVEGEGEIPVEGEAEGEVLDEGEGETPVEGEGEVLPEGEPEEGEGEVPPEGEGEAPVEGEGEVPPEGEGEVPVEGEGEVPPEGETPAEGEGEGEVPVEGEGEYNPLLECPPDFSVCQP